MSVTPHFCGDSRFEMLRMRSKLMLEGHHVSSSLKTASFRTGQTKKLS